jgi:hypothetical protein
MDNFSEEADLAKDKVVNILIIMVDIMEIGQIGQIGHFPGHFLNISSVSTIFSVVDLPTVPDTCSNHSHNIEFRNFYPFNSYLPPDAIPNQYFLRCLVSKSCCLFPKTNCEIPIHINTPSCRIVESQ